MDFINEFFDYTEGIPSPAIFRRWGGIATLSGVLERRIWVRTAAGNAYPNLFLLFLAHPAIGKTQVLSIIRKMWSETKTIYSAPDSLTKASFLDRLSKCPRQIISEGKLLDEFHSMQIAADEFGNLVPTHDTLFLNVLNTVYNNPEDSYSEERRTGTVKELSIYRPSISLIAGTQPGFLHELLPESAWTMGYMSRTIMIYASSGPDVDIFAEINHEEKELRFRELVAKLKEYVKIYGQATLMPSAMDAIKKWRDTKYEPVPQHSKLLHYVGRRLLHILKLSTIACVSRTGGIKIEDQDFYRALGWLLDAEKYMPEIFQEMGVQSHMEIIKDLTFIMMRKYLVDKKPIHMADVYSYLGNKVPADKIEMVMNLAIRSGALVQVQGINAFIPKGIPKNAF